MQLIYFKGKCFLGFEIKVDIVSHYFFGSAIQMSDLSELDSKFNFFAGRNHYESRIFESIKKH